MNRNLRRRDILGLAGGAVLIGASQRTTASTMFDLARESQPDQDRDPLKTPFCCFTMNETTLKGEVDMGLDRHGHRIKFALWDDGLCMWADNWMQPDSNYSVRKADLKEVEKFKAELDRLDVFNDQLQAPLLAINAQLQLRVRIGNNRIVRTWDGELRPGYPDIYAEDAFGKFIIMWYGCIRTICTHIRSGDPWRTIADAGGSVRGYVPSRQLNTWWMRDVSPWMP